MQQEQGSGGGSVGRAVASDARGPRFESNHLQIFISDIYLFTVNCIEKTKRGREWPISKNMQQEQNRRCRNP